MESDDRDVFSKVGRCTYLRINLDAITHNVEYVRSKCAQHTGIIGVIKTAAYGHGSQVVGRHLKDIGVERLAVATPGEGALLRKANIGGPIHVFGNANATEADTLLASNLIPTASTKEFIKHWSELIKSEKCRCQRDVTKNENQDADCCHGKIAIEVDTGMTSNGISPNDLDDCVRLCDEKEVDIDSICTEFTNPFNDDEGTKRQLDRFMAVAAPYRSRGIKLHVANSGAIFKGFGTDLDFVRPCVALYGLMSRHDLKDMSEAIDLEVDDGNLGLQPALAWLAKPTSVKTLPSEIIATLSVGTDDGFSKEFFNKGCVRCEDGRYCPVIGSSVSRDEIAVNVDSLDDENRTFYIISDDYDPKTSAFARTLQFCLGTLSSIDKIVTKLSMRIPRVYFQGGRLKHIVKDIADMY